MHEFELRILDRNNRLKFAGLDISYFTGYFGKEIAKNGCQIFISCRDENHIDELKPKLRKFLDEQYLEPEPHLPRIA